MISMYVTASWFLFFAVLVIVLLVDTLERFQLFGFKQDHKLGSAVTGVVWPITLSLVCSTMPFVNLVWVVFGIIVGWNNYKAHR